MLRGKPLLALAERIEAAGALTLAFSILAYARQAWDKDDPASAAEAIRRQGRICRTIGAPDMADQYYVFLYAYATRHHLHESRGAAFIGRGVLRCVGGELLAGARWFAKARAASRHHPVIVAGSYYGEMAVALANQDHSAALIAGTRALRSGGLSDHDAAGVLSNLAGIAQRAGRPKTALHLLRQAMRRTKHPRLRTHFFAKAALAAARMGRVALVERFGARLIGEAVHFNLPADELEARSELAQAFDNIGQRAKAARIARSVRAEAETRGLAIIVARCDAILAGEEHTPAPITLGAPARRAIAVLETV